MGKLLNLPISYKAMVSCTMISEIVNIGKFSKLMIVHYFLFLFIVNLNVLIDFLFEKMSLPQSRSIIIYITVNNPSRFFF